MHLCLQNYIPVYINLTVMLCIEPWTAAKKALSVIVPPALSRFLSKDHLSWVSRQSGLSANDNEMIPGAVHKSVDV